MMWFEFISQLKKEPFERMSLNRGPPSADDVAGHHDNTVLVRGWFSGSKPPVAKPGAALAYAIGSFALQGYARQNSAIFQLIFSAFRPASHAAAAATTRVTPPKSS